MPITHVTYSYVENGGAVPSCTSETVSDAIKQYLTAHVDALLKRSNEASTPQAEFTSTEARTRFEQLRTGSDAEFLSAAQDLARQLHREMDGRSEPGFFVGLRRTEGPTTLAAALKLDVKPAGGAAVSHTAGGRRRLEAVEELLDLPGELQKGAIVPDERADSEVVVGDTLPETSLYFLRGFDVRQVSAPGPAVKTLLNTVRRVAPKSVEAVAVALDAEQRAVTVDRFFADHAALLDDTERAAVVGQLAQVKRPVRLLDTRRHPTMRIVTADGVVIRGRATTLTTTKLRWEPRQGGYRILIDVDEEPTERWE
jgi:hypothetical protein